MTLTVTWAGGSRSWSLELPTALQNFFPARACAGVLNRAAVERAVGVVAPVLPLAAEAAGAGVPELLLLLAAVEVAKRALSDAPECDPAPPDLSKPIGNS